MKSATELPVQFPEDTLNGLAEVMERKQKERDRAVKAEILADPLRYRQRVLAQAVKTALGMAETTIQDVLAPVDHLGQDERMNVRGNLHLMAEPTPEPEPNDKTAYRFQRSGTMWDVQFGDKGGHFADQMGFGIIAALLAEPNPKQPISALVLAERNSPENKAIHTNQPAADEDTGRKYLVQIGEYDREIEDANKSGDEPRAERVQREKNDLLARVRKDTNLLGRSRNIGPVSAAESARTSCRAAINRAISKLRKGTPPLDELADHLAHSIKGEGIAFAYRTNAPPGWEF